MTAAVSLNRLVKQYGAKVAVDGISFDVPKGAIFGLLGRNGAGKTTTIRMIMDIIRPDSGDVFVLGEQMQTRTKDRIGYLPEERGLYPKMLVMDQLEFQGTIKGVSAAEARKRASHWLDRLELGKEKQNKVEELSKGMQQKVQFIAAIIGEPELLILDEPFSGMDPKNQDLFKDMILELNRQGTTIIFSTHVMDSAERMCQEIALIDHGKAVLSGTIPAIKERFGKNSVLLEFSGDGSHFHELPFVEKVDDYGQYLELRLKEGSDPQAVLQAAVGRVAVRKFEIATPTLHNIFIQQVG